MKRILLGNLLFLLSLSIFAQSPQDEINLIESMSFQILNVQTAFVDLEVTVTSGSLPTNSELILFVENTSAILNSKIGSNETQVHTLTFRRTRFENNEQEDESYYLGCEITTTNSSQSDGCIVTIGGDD